MVVNVNWDQLKTFISERNLNIHSIDLGGFYSIYAIDGAFMLSTMIQKLDDSEVDSDQEDFETNYLVSANQKLKTEVIIEATTAFSNKILPDGKKLYARETGIPEATINSGNTGSLVFEIPYELVKITDVEIIGCQKGDTVDFKILDTDVGLLTTIPLYPVNQFGFNVNMPNSRYFKKYDYDADLFLGLHVCVEYTNNGPDPVTISVNLGLHEVKD